MNPNSILKLYLLAVVYVKCSFGQKLNDSTQPSLLECNTENLNECKTEFPDQKVGCSEEYPLEIYRDVFMPLNKTLWMGCCHNASDSQNSMCSRMSYSNYAKNCRSTKCLPSSQNLCSTFHPRYINNTLQVYEEVYRDTCRTSAVTSGNVALCCRTNSIEKVLTVLLGAEPHEFPHHVLVNVRTATGSSSCGGTIYNNRFIITAAHCLVKMGVATEAKSVSIVVGTNNHDMDQEAVDYVYQGKNIFVHENYTGLITNVKYPLLVNDIGLIELKKDLIFKDTVRPLELAPMMFDPFKYADNVVVVGWGTTLTNQHPKYLQKQNFVLRKDNECFSNDIRLYNGYKHHEKELLCIGGISSEKVSLVAGRGDSGGPAICKTSSGNPVLCGVTSIGGSDEACETSGSMKHCIPSVYVETSYYHNWIVRHAGKQNKKDLFQYPLYGEDVSRGEYPHQVYIASPNSNDCGGTLVEPDVVVTAAHCVYDLDAGNNIAFLKVKIHHGDKVYSIKSARKMKAVKEGWSIDNMTANDKAVFGENRYKNDLAVILLNKNASINVRKLAVLSTVGVVASKIDYGVEVSFVRSVKKSRRVVRRTLKILKEDECRYRLNLIGKTQIKIRLEENEICGIEAYSGGSICDRTLGGGLLCGKDAKGREKICGVQVYRTCMFAVPGIFVDISKHADWILKTVADLKQGKK